MDNQIVVQATGEQKRIALIENGELAQFFIESPENRRSVGDIFLAEVHKVMGGIRAAFIDLSTPKDGFLHYSDLGEHLEEYLVMLNGRNAVSKKASEDLMKFRQKMADKNSQKNTSREESAHEQNLIGSLLRPGQKVMVQVVKEPIGSKGPRVSTDITLAGRFLVLIPFGDYVAVSKRIRSYKERRRLKSIIGEMLPNGFGVIVRTVAEGQDDDVLRGDLKDLHDKWVGIQEKLKKSKPTALLHRDLDMTESLVRDLFSKNYSRILIDDPESYKTIREYISKVAPAMVKNVQEYKGREHVFDHMNISRDVNSIFSPRVKMPSGGYLIFEQTEAMYVVDVNSGRYAAKKAQEDNSLKTNLEAAREIAKQLRLRDIGGIIVVDFIDLQQDSNRKKVYDEIRREFKKDRAKTNILPMSDFGVMQITRQRIRPSVVKSVSKVCPMCGGSGSIVSESTLLSDIEAWISKFRHNYSYRSIELYVNPFFHSVLCQGLISTRLKWMFKYMMRITIENDESISLNDFKVTLRGSEFDLAETVNNGESIEEAIALNQKRMAEMESGGRRRPEMLDFYDKKSAKSDDKPSSGDARKFKSSKDKKSDDEAADSSASRKRPVPARISSSARSGGKIKSKYYKKSEDEAAKPDNSAQETKTEQKSKPADDAPKSQKDKNNGTNGSAQASDKPAALEVAKEYYYSEKPPQEKEKPAALEIAKAHAEELKQEQKEENKPAPAAKKQDTNQPAEESPQTNQPSEEQPAKKAAAAPVEKTEETPDSASEEKEAHSEEQETQAGEAAETPAAEKNQKSKAAKKVKRPAPARRKKAVANPSRVKDEASGTKAEKTAETPKEAPKNDAKAEKLREMDAVKATLNEEVFRKPASIPAGVQQPGRVVTTTVGKKEKEAQSGKAAPASKAKADDQKTSEKASVVNTSVLKSSPAASDESSRQEAKNEQSPDAANAKKDGRAKTGQPNNEQDTKGNS